MSAYVVIDQFDWQRRTYRAGETYAEDELAALGMDADGLAWARRRGLLEPVETETAEAPPSSPVLVPDED